MGLTTSVLLLEVIYFRALPFAAAFALSRTRRVDSGMLVVFALLTAGGLLALGVPQPKLFAILASYSYLLLLGCGIPPLAGMLAAGRVTKAAVLLLLVMGLLVLPGVLLPPWLSPAFLTLGWELVLAAYSYCVETTRDTRRSLRGCLFFLLVDPVLVYPERATPVTKLRARRERSHSPRGRSIPDSGVANPRNTGSIPSDPRLALEAPRPRIDRLLSPGEGEGADGRSRRRQAALLARLGLGMLAMWLGIVLAHPLSAPSRWLDEGAPGYLTFMALGTHLFIARYAALSGLASFQIAAMRLLGYKLPERYVYPFLATSPADLWRRWNLYIGSWFKRYVYYPSGLWLGHAPRAWLRAVGQSAALALTLVLVGVFHDLFTYVAGLNAGLSGTGAFSIVAGAMLLWHIVARRLSFSGSAATRSSNPTRVRWPRLTTALARVACLHLVCLVARAFAA